MGEVFISLGFGGIGYLSGSLMFAVWVTRIVKGVDVREAGSGHASTTNTVRQAGWLAGIIVLMFDIGKGYLPTYFAFKYAPLEWAVPVTAILAVAGHCWPIFAQFRGGMGMATAGGTTLAVYPLGFAIALGIVISLMLILKHASKASVIAAFLYAPVFYLFGERGQIIWLIAGISLVLAGRFYIDWNREYSELWLDRGKS